MRKFFENLLAFAGRHLADVLALFMAFLFFFLVSGFFITEKGIFEKLFAPGVGFFGGLLSGGIIGWIVGGIGVAAMGTAVGVGAFGAVLIGGIAGAALGALTGASFSFVQMVRNPSDFDVNWIALLLVFFGAAIVFFLVRWTVQWMVLHLPSLARRFSSQQRSAGENA